jgi:hypothetical protein
VALLAAVGAAACGGSSNNRPAGDGSTDTISISCLADAGAARANGEACACSSDCQSGFCADGVCCNSACNETCRACNVQGSPGICTVIPAGNPPRTLSECPTSDESTCGLDGACDGKGACRKHVAGTVCKAGTCGSGAVMGIQVCDGDGRCKAGPATICAPYDCDATTNACVVTCRSDADCVSGVTCVNGSCGPKPRGAVCAKDGDCASGFCTDGVCCNVRCRGACVSCDQVGRGGSCWPVDEGNPDPRGMCRDQGPASCGQTGACDGLGGCSLYAAETVCVAPSCSADLLNTAGTCNGLGRCQAPGVRSCAPYRCSDGACIARCAGDADCVAGQVCQNGSCGPKPNGQPCASAGECVSNLCVDGLCCDSACGGACRSCALPSSMGKCASVPAGAVDPRHVCVDQGAGSCGTDGKCDGASGCNKYEPGTQCAPETCAAGVYTPPAACSESGACVAPDATTCAPFACNGARCFVACTTDDNCAPGQVCRDNSCGLKPNGAFCADRRECTSGNCAQGVCCATGCASACKSCALTTTMGLCTNVPDGLPDPTGTCLDQGAASCGGNGRCQAGACQVYPQGTACKPATCPSGTTTFTPAGSCDGAGTCLTSTATSCFPFRCGVAACKATCTADADCAPPAVCGGGSCGLKNDGAVCGAGSECASGICAQGACCKTACAGTCMSCAVIGSAGSCVPVAAGERDPAGQCRDQGAASCATTGVCDGAGGCQLYAAGTECAPPSCPAGATTATLARSCDGAGACKPATTQSCAPYNCNGTACKAACASDADCVAGTVCNAGSCGKKRLGQICAAGSECDGGNCVDGVCCSSASCGTCASCNVTGNAGRCSPVPAGAMEPHGGCASAPPCGFNGTCDGAGACRAMPAGTACGAASCSGSTLTPAGTCDGAGACRQSATSCSPYVCSADACRTTCVTTTDCAPGYSCLGGSCTNLAANGVTCTTNSECISGHCLDGFCCGSGACSPCNSCAIAGHEGTCWPIADGTVCGAASCDGNDRLKPTSTCLAGACMMPARIECTPFACDAPANACKTSCAVDGDCAKKMKCTPGTAGGPGVCAP